MDWSILYCELLFLNTVHMLWASQFRESTSYETENRSSIPGTGGDFVFITSTGAHPTSYPIGTGGAFPRGKAAGTLMFISIPQYAISGAYRHTETTCLLYYYDHVIAIIITSR